MTEYVLKCSEYQKQKIKTFRELGLCKCGNKALPDKRSCQECLDKSKRWYQTKGHMRYIEQRAFRKQNNLCVTCGENIVAGQTECKCCSEKRRARYLRFYERKGI